jgi:SAM-dependent methyltransferase
MALTIPARTERKRARYLRTAVLSSDESRLIREASSRIDPSDLMYLGDFAHYAGVGLSAIRCIDAAMSAAGSGHPRNVLDLPSGGGRVLRLLLPRFPSARIVACDLDKDALAFCRRNFPTVSVMESDADLDALDLGILFDLIWCGSLATHLDAPSVSALLRLFHRHLAPSGLAVFSTHGDFVAERIPRRSEFDYLLTDDQIRSLVAQYPRGFAYVDYPGSARYGVSLISPEWLRRRIAAIEGLEEVWFKPRGWDDHHDVYGVLRTD